MSDKDLEKRIDEGEQEILKRLEELDRQEILDRKRALLEKETRRRDRYERNEKFRTYAKKFGLIALAVGTLTVITYLAYNPAKTAIEKGRSRRIENQHLIDSIEQTEIAQRHVIDSLANIVPENDLPKIIKDNYTVKPGIYHIDHNINISMEGALTIPAGTTIHFNNTKQGITVNGGSLNILGKSNKPVILDAFQDDKNGVETEYWKGITIIDSKKDNLIQYAIIRNVKNKDKGGGLMINNSKLKLSQSTIEKCLIDDKGIGGGILNDNDSDIEIINSKIINNVGTGVYNRNSRARIEKSSIEGNSTESNGGGIYNEYSNVKIISGKVQKNSARSGGGIHNSNSEVNIYRTEITENIAEKRGGGIYSERSRDTLDAVIIKKNSITTGFWKKIGAKFVDYGISIYADSESRITLLGKYDIEEATQDTAKIEGPAVKDTATPQPKTDSPPKAKPASTTSPATTTTVKTSDAPGSAKNSNLDATIRTDPSTSISGTGKTSDPVRVPDNMNMTENIASESVYQPKSGYAYSINDTLVVFEKIDQRSSGTGGYLFQTNMKNSVDPLYRISKERFNKLYEQGNIKELGSNGRELLIRQMQEIIKLNRQTGRSGAYSSGSNYSRPAESSKPANLASPKLGNTYMIHDSALLCQRHISNPQELYVFVVTNTNVVNMLKTMTPERFDLLYRNNEVKDITQQELNRRRREMSKFLNR